MNAYFSHYVKKALKAKVKKESYNLKQSKL